MCGLLNFRFSPAAGTVNTSLFVSFLGIKLVLLRHFLVNDYLSKCFHQLELTGVDSDSSLESHHLCS